MLPLPPIRTGHDSSKSFSFKPCGSRASGTGSHRCIGSMLPVFSAWGERIHSFLGSELHIFLHILGHA